MRTNAPIRIVAALLLVLLFAARFPAVAALPNDPGHDTLYVLKLGDSNVTGTINITGNLTAELVQATSRFFGPNLDIRGDGTSSAAVNRIIGTATDLELSSTGNLLLEQDGGNVIIGSVGTPANLNVTGDLNADGSISSGGTLVCLANGTNCVNGNNTGNVSSVTAGSGLTDTGTTSDPVLNVGAGTGITVNANDVAINPTYTQRRVSGTCNAGEAIKTINQDGTVTCESTSGADGTGGWTNTSTTTSTSLDVNVTTGDLTVATGKVGIGTTSPGEKLEVAGRINASTDVCITGGLCLSQAGAGSQNLSDVLAQGNSAGSYAIDMNNQLITNIGSSGTDFTSGGGLTLAGAFTASSTAALNGGTTIGDAAGDSLTINSQAASIPNNLSFNSGTLFIDSTNGKVGIGTTAPEERLHIQETSGSAFMVIETLSDDFAQFELRNNDTNGVWKWQFSERNAAESHHFRFTRYDPTVGSWKPIMDLTPDGEVGIGTKSPGAPLHIAVNGTSIPSIATKTGLIVSKTDVPGANSAISIIAGNESAGSYINFGDTDDEDIGFIQYYHIGDEMRFGTNGSQQMVIDKTGNVGIGTTSPGAKLEVAGDIKIGSNGIKFIDPENGNAAVELRASDSGYPDEGIAVRTLTNPASGQPIFRVISSGGSERLRVEHDGYLKTSNNLAVDGTGNSYIQGKVGIGTTSPGSELTVVGDANVTGDLYLGGNLTGYDIAEFIHTSSDLEPGDVALIDREKDESLVKAGEPYSTRVAGIISMDPGVKLNRPEDKGQTHRLPLALSGRVPVHAINETGPILRGDLLTTSSTPGYVMRCPSIDQCRGAIVGKALSKLEKGTGTITALVMLG